MRTPHREQLRADAVAVVTELDASRTEVATVLRLPDSDGIAVCRKIAASTSTLEVHSCGPKRTMVRSATVLNELHM